MTAIKRDGAGGRAAGGGDLGDGGARTGLAGLADRPRQPEEGRAHWPAHLGDLARRAVRGAVGLARRTPGEAVALARRHWLFTTAAGAGLALRAAVILGFAPAVLFRLDTYDYLWDATHLTPNVVNPGGYSLFLRLLWPFHSLVLVAAVQHALGLGVATGVYALARRYRLPAWGATLAAAPVLFDPAQLLVEQFVMADLLAMALMTAALLTLLLGRGRPALARCGAAGLLAGLSVIVRPTSAPLLLLIPAYLLLRQAGWRRAGCGLLAGTVPVVAYMSWFAAVHGSFNLTNSNGLFLWSRTMSFAECAAIRPPADLRPLCPGAQVGMPAAPAARPLPKRYLWDHRLWQWREPSRGPVPDTAAFTPANNARALRFAVAAITAQPLAYAGQVLKESVSPLVITDSLRFPVTAPAGQLHDANISYALAAISGYAGSDQGLAPHLSYTLGTRETQPWARLVDVYQRVVFLPGPVFGLVVLVGLAGLLSRRRRTLDGALLWVAGVIMMVLPTAEHEYTYRYVIPSVPLLCLAATLALRRPANGTATTSTATTSTAAKSAAERQR